jgi:hypothetical protein
VETRDREASIREVGRLPEQGHREAESDSSNSRCASLVTQINCNLRANEQGYFEDDEFSEPGFRSRRFSVRSICTTTPS